MNTRLSLIAALPLAAALAAVPACKEKSPAASEHAHADHGHDHADDTHDHGPTAGHGGPVIELGEAVIGAFNAHATRDAGALAAGGDAAVDITLTPISSTTIRVAAVRIWIGAADARGSVKARAEVENPNEPNRWHNHVELPNPMPPDSKLWVEIEDDQGGTTVGSFELKI